MSIDTDKPHRGDMSLLRSLVVGGRSSIDIPLLTELLQHERPTRLASHTFFSVMQQLGFKGTIPFQIFIVPSGGVGKPSPIVLRAISLSDCIIRVTIHLCRLSVNG